MYGLLITFDEEVLPSFNFQIAIFIIIFMSIPVLKYTDNIKLY